MSTLPMNQAKLREAMRDQRYWQQGHPEREGYVGWVTDAWRSVIEGEGDSPDGMVHVQAHQRGAPARAWESQSNSEWRARIAKHETNRDRGDFGYGVRASPPSTALGRYQVNRATLQEAGWKDESGRWTRRARAAGIASDADFLTNPSAQEAAFDDVPRSCEVQLRSYGLLQRAGTMVPRMDGSPQSLTVGGLVAATHREGIGTVVRYFAHRDANRQRPPALPSGQRGDLSKFNQVEARLAEFASVPYERLR